MKFISTTKELTEVLSNAPRNTMNIQGGNTALVSISCMHKDYGTLLHVQEKGCGKHPPKLSGNPKAALKMSIDAAKNVRDDLLEHYRNIVLYAC